ncbi:GNAT family N-acetyltransferase [Falsarthrobacter nasiphocae]|nr:GNAT family N-acetyltransferase [Falsarthrobacter nasiphocae]
MNPTPQPATQSYAALSPTAGPAFRLRPVDPAADAPILHRWFTEPRGRFWGMGSASVADVRAEYERLAARPGHDCLLGLDSATGEPAFLAEIYDPATSPLAGLPELRRGDVGMHLFLAPPSAEPIPGYSLAAMRRVLAECFGRYGARRVVVEPDVRNEAVHRLNARAGFRVLREAELNEGPGQPPKRALLSTVERWTFRPVGSHLRPEIFEQAERRLTAKLLAEFAHERLILPELVDDDDAAAAPSPAACGGKAPANVTAAEPAIPSASAAEPTGPAPRTPAPRRYGITLDDGSRVLFTATRHLLEHWVVEPRSIVVVRSDTPTPHPTPTPGATPAQAPSPSPFRGEFEPKTSRKTCETRPGTEAEEGEAGEARAEAPNTGRIVLGLRSRLPLTDELTPLYLEEIQATLASIAAKIQHVGPSSEQLAEGTDAFGRRLGRAEAFQQVESAMTEGHPCFIANSGRHGMGARDLAAWAPESGEDIRLVWLAVSRRNAHFSCVPGFEYEALRASQFSARELEAFDSRLRERGLDPEQYVLLPAHPWQADHKILQSFAAEVAAGDIVILGESEDLFRPQQSLRTFFNVSAPERFYAKTALSVVNMGFMRGLSAEYMRDTPAINEWLAGLFAGDAELGRTRVGLIREVCAVGYRSPLYTEASVKGSPYRKMLSGLWRESPVAQTGEGQELATMASLLHRDAQGVSFVSRLIARSGVGAQAWLAAYLEAYLVPVVHCLAAHRLAFMPHGENVILCLRGGLVERVFMKDIGEEIAVLTPPDGDSASPPTPELPEGVDRIYAPTPSSDVCLSVFTDVFDCFFRFLAPILAEDGLLAEDGFWAEVRRVLAAYEARHPGSEWLGLFAPEFELSCLNRLQLRNTRHMLDLEDQNGGLAKAGMLRNPVARGR